MAYFRNTVTTISFIVLFSTILGAIPSNYYTATEYETYSIPTTFSAWMLSSNGTDIENTLNQGGVAGIYNFNEINSGYHDIYVAWGSSIFNPNDDILVKRKVGMWDFNPSIFDQRIDKTLAVAEYDDDDNAAVFVLEDERGYIFMLLEDDNVTRKDIGTAWDDGTLNCTISYFGASSGVDQVSAVQLVVSLLTFSLPTIYTDMNPLMGMVISVIVYIPIIMTLFTTVVKAAHG